MLKCLTSSVASSYDWYESQISFNNKTAQKSLVPDLCVFHVVNFVLFGHLGVTGWIQIHYNWTREMIQISVFTKTLSILHQWEQCTLYNPTSRSTQRTYGAPREVRRGWGGGAMENGWKQGGRRSGGEQTRVVQPPMTGWYNGVWEAGKRCRRVNVLVHVVRLSVREGLEASKVFVWSRGGLAARQSRQWSVIPLLSSPFLAPWPPSSSFCSCIYKCEPNETLMSCMKRLRSWQMDH